MSAELQAVVARVRAVFEAQREGWEWELACKSSVGRSVVRRRDELPQSETWVEQALCVRVRGEDGRSALASAAGWETAETIARAALADARRQRLPGAETPAFANAWADELDAPGESPAGPDEAELLRWLDLVRDGAEAADERAGLLQLGRARAATVRTRLVNSHGLDLVVDQPLAHLEAEVLGRELRKHAGCSRSLAAPCIDDSGATALGDELGRAIRRQFDGVPRAPGEGRVLLTSDVVGEISFRLAPALLGLTAAAVERDGPRMPEGLRLREDSAEDDAARSVPADGAGRRLELVDLVRDGSLVRPELDRLPLVRPGIADAPRSGWLRLSWTSEGGRSDEELVQELGTGLLVERAVTDSFDPANLSWTGQVEGWWVEGGVGKRAVARLPLTLDLPSLLPTVLAVGAEPMPAHGSGTIRALPWLLDGLPAET